MRSVEIAIRMETDAMKFYREAAYKTKHPVCKEMFLSIAEDEKRHLDALSAIFRGTDVELRDINPKERIKTIFETMRDEMMQRVEATADELEAFRIAMQMEKEGIKFYNEAASGTENEKEKALFQRLAKEEDQHYGIFSETYSFLSDTGNWYMWDDHSIVEG